MQSMTAVGVLGVVRQVVGGAEHDRGVITAPFDPQTYVTSDAIGTR